MEFSSVVLGLETLTSKNIQEMHNDMNNYKTLEIDTKEFLIHFFRKDILESLFIKQILIFGPKAVNDFQEHTFKYVREYMSSLINIDGLTFSFNPNEFPSKISIYLSEMILCNVDIYNKKVEVLDEYYFEDIIKEKQRLYNERNNLLKEYEKFNRYSINSMELLKDNKDISMLQSIDIMISSGKKKNNKYKNESKHQCMLIESKIHEIDLELEEYIMIENTLRKNMLSINYYQNRIADRLSRNLKYTIIKK